MPTSIRFPRWCDVFPLIFLHRHVIIRYKRSIGGDGSCTDRWNEPLINSLSFPPCIIEVGSNQPSSSLNIIWSQKRHVINLTWSIIKKAHIQNNIRDINFSRAFSVISIPSNFLPFVMSASKRSSSSSSSSSAGISASSNGAAPASTDPPPTKIARTVFKPYCFVSISSQASCCVLTSYVKICWIDMPYAYNIIW